MFDKFFKKFYKTNNKGNYIPSDTTLPDVVADSTYVVSKYAQDHLDQVLYDFKFKILDDAAKITTQFSERFNKPKVDEESIKLILHKHNLDEERI